MIGKMLTKQGLQKQLLVSLLFCLIPAFFPIVLLSFFFTSLPFFGMWLIFDFLMAIYHVISLCHGEFMVITKDTFNYYNAKNRKEARILFYRTITSQNYPAEYVIPTKEIIKVKVTYRYAFFRPPLNGFGIVFILLLKNGSSIKISPELIISKEGAYLEGLNLLKNQGVEIVDPVNLCSVLDKDRYVIQDYLKKIESEKKL